ncbi:diguanylate cyclase domain-containing protein [Simiduia agarivorans]|uniref:Diguanylate cyclase n=1 Tax=Simiduia agarivorans (strain DSM 21679 / JCM 13881 / BCRC 17597 / SA1) TaxID=1117647 RepID=K4KGQ0_SIMAS|nr:diguanylate cyclase [Simiduia agarivorans]AFU97385.1 diguanylate cyclase [Simiduia agarivorans SA1 = DSM 21679]
MIDQLKKNLRRRAIGDSLLLAGLSVCTFLVFASLDVFELLHLTLEELELYELDEVLSASLVIALLFAGFSWRRWQDVRRLQRYCEELSMIDPATELPNRRAIERLLSHPAQHQDELPLSLILVNLSGMEALQQRYGAQVAEQTLLRYLYQCAHVLNDRQLLSIYGMNQLLIYSPGTDEAAADQLARKLEHTEIHSPIVQGLLTYQAVALCLAQNKDFTGALEHLEDKLYQRLFTAS